MKKRAGLMFLISVMIGCCFVSQTAALTINGQECVSNEILVKFKPGVAFAAMQSIVSKLGGLELTGSSPYRHILIRIPDGLVAQFIKLFKAHPAVAFAEPNYIYKAFLTPNDEYFNLQWHLTQINVEEAWDLSAGEGVTVAVLDSGVSPYGKDGFGQRLQQGYNAFWQLEGHTEDFNFHGTHVAGTIGAETNNGIGVAGIAHKASIMPVKVLDRFGSGTLFVVINGIYWATDHGADIINMSLGGSEGSESLQEAITYAYDRGVILIAASGNDAGPVAFPAAYPEVIAVGALDYNKNLAPYSNFGPEQDLVAPGGDTTADSNEDGWVDGVVQETFWMFWGFRRFALGWDYYFLNGTSQASPHVAGVAALLLAKHPTWGPDDVLNALTATAEDRGEPGLDDMYGHGLINAAAALNYTP